MADHIEKCNMDNAIFLKNAFSVHAVKEERQEDSFVDDKVQISETAIVTEGQANLLYDKIKQCNILTTLNNIKVERSSPKIQYNIIHNNIKIENPIGSDDIKIDFNNELLYCEDCHAYYQDYCGKCGMLVYILNRIPSIDADNTPRTELPNILEIQSYFGGFHIVALKVIPVGVRFGPFAGLNRTEHCWKIKGGKFVVNSDTSKYLNWMQYINPARIISERNLLVFQYDDNLYYQSTCQIQAGNELFVYFGEEYEDSLNRNVEMDLIPTAEHIFKDAFACTFCCIGFSSKTYLAKHKAICPGNLDRGFSIEELTQCPFCKISLDQKEYIKHHMTYCCKMNDRKCILPTTSDRSAQVSERKTRQYQLYKCEQCKYRTKYKGDLKIHTNLHYEVKKYKCRICCQRYKTEEFLRRHVGNTHICADEQPDVEHSTRVYANTPIKPERACSQDEMKQLKCVSCEFRTKYKSNLKRHMTEKHLKKCSYKCDACDYKANRKSILKSHIEMKHLKEFQYKCDRCGYKTNLNCRLDTHVKTRHLNQFKYKCDTCDYKANRKYYLDRHIERRHLKEFKYKCDTCDYKASQKFLLKSHIETKHLKEFKYKCGTCDYETNFKSNLDTHIKARHTKEFKYKCDKCRYKTNIEWNLKNHINTIHLKEFKYKCDLCDYKTNRQPDLKRHTETRHSKVFKYNCETCDYKTNWKTSLQTHTKTIHLKEFKYKCDGCDYKTNTKSKLKTHTDAIHLKLFKYKCDACDYKTNKKSTLNSHVDSSHLKEFRYRCDTCEYKTSWKYNLKIHIEAKHTKEFSHKCEKCDYKANYMSNLKEHMKRKHL